MMRVSIDKCHWWLGQLGCLMVRDPGLCSGCGHRRAERRAGSAQSGWHVFGDVCLQDKEKIFHCSARNGETNVSACHTDADPEGDATLLAHGVVAECALVFGSRSRAWIDCKTIYRLHRTRDALRDIGRATAGFHQSHNRLRKTHAASGSHRNSAKDRKRKHPTFNLRGINQ